MDFWTLPLAPFLAFLVEYATLPEDSRGRNLVAGPSAGLWHPALLFDIVSWFFKKNNNTPKTDTTQ